MPKVDVSADSLGQLLDGVLSADRFKKWRASIVGGSAKILGRYAFGEIFWKKALGRPNTANLSDGFEIDAKHFEVFSNYAPGGVVYPVSFDLPYFASWWDGKDDDDHWRISFMVPNMIAGEPTQITPRLKTRIAWLVPGGRLGIRPGEFRTRNPHFAAFVKKEGPVYFQFEVILKSLF